MLFETPHFIDNEIETRVEMNYLKLQSYILGEPRIELDPYKTLLQQLQFSDTFLARKVFAEIKWYPAHYIKLLEVELLWYC